MKNVRVIFHDTGPDDYGRRRFSLLWDDPDGVFRPEPSKQDGKPVGYRRGQCFRAKPEEHIPSGATVLPPEIDR